MRARARRTRRLGLGSAGGKMAHGAGWERAPQRSPCANPSGPHGRAGDAGRRARPASNVNVVLAVIEAHETIVTLSIRTSRTVGRGSILRRVGRPRRSERGWLVSPVSV